MRHSSSYFAKISPMLPSVKNEDRKAKRLGISTACMPKHTFRVRAFYCIFALLPGA